jgi:hypothetical protein
VLRRDSAGAIPLFREALALADEHGDDLTRSEVHSHIGFHYLESVHLAEPSVEAGFLDPLVEVADDLDEAGAGSRVDAHARAADAGVLVLAGCAVGPAAGVQSELAGVEVSLHQAKPPRRCGRGVRASTALLVAPAGGEWCQPLA